MCKRIEYDFSLYAQNTWYLVLLCRHDRMKIHLAVSENHRFVPQLPEACFKSFECADIICLRPGSFCVSPQIDPNYSDTYSNRTILDIRNLEKHRQVFFGSLTPCLLPFWTKTMYFQLFPACLGWKTRFRPQRFLEKVSAKTLKT